MVDSSATSQPATARIAITETPSSTAAPVFAGPGFTGPSFGGAAPSLATGNIAKSDDIESGVSSLYGLGNTEEPQYTRGVACDPTDPNRIVVGYEEAGGDDVLETRYSSDGGLTYEFEQEIARSSTEKIGRPQWIRDPFPGGPRLAWWQGAYTTFGNYNTEVRVTPGITRLFAPVNDAPPGLTGNALVGETLVVVPGEWRGGPAPTLSYQWKRDGNPISGETGTSYVLVEDDQGAEITVAETATNSQGSAVSESGAVVPSAGGPFHPTQISSIWADWDPGLITSLSDGQGVATLPDGSSNGRDMTQATAGNQLTFETNELNGKPVIRSADATDSMAYTGGAPGQTGDLHVFVVAKRAGGGQGVLSTRNGSAGWLLREAATGASYAHIGATITPGGATTQNSGAFTASNWAVIELRRDDLVSQIGSNGALSASATWTGFPTSSSRVDICRESNPAGTPAGTPWAGDIARILVFNGVLSSDDRTAVLDYLEAEYGVVTTP